MKRTLILYASTHHGNTRRLAEAMARRRQGQSSATCSMTHCPTCPAMT